MHFVAYDEIDGRPNVVVDGAGTDGTLLTLSHWPGSRVPRSLQADLSAEIALRYLEQPALHVPAEAVTNNHFDEDGLMGVFALVDPETALAHQQLVIDVARAGDFGWSNTLEAARISFAISALADPHTSPLDGAVFDCDYPHLAASLYRELLPRIPALLTDVERHRDLWVHEDAHLDDSNRAFAEEAATITDHADLDLAIVRVTSDIAARTTHRFTQRRSSALHPMAVHNRTAMTRLAYVCGRRYEVQLRYETWVQLVSRRPLPRPDLAVLATRLDELESSGGSWQFEDPGSITPSLTLVGADESSIEPERFLAELFAFLPDAPAAWDPWTARH